MHCRRSGLPLNTKPGSKQVGETRRILDALLGHPTVRACPQLFAAATAHKLAQPSAARFCEKERASRVRSGDGAFERDHGQVAIGAWGKTEQSRLQGGPHGDAGLVLGFA